MSNVLLVTSKDERPNSEEVFFENGFSILDDWALGEHWYSVRVLGLKLGVFSARQRAVNLITSLMQGTPECVTERGEGVFLGPYRGQMVKRVLYAMDGEKAVHAAYVSGAGDTSLEIASFSKTLDFLAN